MYYNPGIVSVYFRQSAKLPEVSEWYILALLQTFNHCKSNENRIIMCNLKLIYKRLVKKKKRLSENNKIREIERLRHAKPKDFWKLFTKKRNTNSNISLEDFFNYFSSLHQDLINVQEQESEEFCHN